MEMTKKMNIVMMKISDIKEYDNNPRKNDNAVEAVASSIRSFGFKVPIIIDSNNVIIAGHTRLKASKKLGYQEVPCLIADDLTDEQVKAYRLADNKVAEASEWDIDLLEREIADILNIDMQDFGFILEQDDEIMREDISDKVIEKYEIIIIKCPDEMTMQQAYEKLTSEGYECKLSTL